MNPDEDPDDTESVETAPRMDGRGSNASGDAAGRGDAGGNDTGRGDERGNDDSTPSGSYQTGIPTDLERPDGFDWRGWVVVLVVLVSFLVVPIFVLYLPEAHWFLSTIGFSRRQAYIVFPMIPAILLGITAVWAALRSLSSSQ